MVVLQRHDRLDGRVPTDLSEDTRLKPGLVEELDCNIASYDTHPIGVGLSEQLSVVSFLVWCQV